MLPAIWQFVRYIRQVIAAKRAKPQDDLIWALVQAEETGDPPSCASSMWSRCVFD